MDKGVKQLTRRVDIFVLLPAFTEICYELFDIWTTLTGKFLLYATIGKPRTL